MSTAVLPASAGPVVALNGRNGLYVGYNMTFTAAGRVRLWSGPQANPSAPAGAPAVQGPLADVDATGAGTFDFSIDDVMNGEQYINGITVELVSGAMPATGVVRFRGPHS